MTENAILKAIKRLALISGAFLIASLLISGVSVYVTLAAPLHTPFVPTTVGFEGQLADANGGPVADDDYVITFRLYDVASGGTALWTETHEPVTVTDGLYSVQLGGSQALNPTYFEGPRWLGIQVSGDSEMMPRIPISAVPFALNAQQAMGIQGRDISTNAPSDGDVLRWDATSERWIPSGSELPSGTIILMPGSCPDGFIEYTAARGRYVVGLPLDGTIGATVGAALSDQENRPVGQHSHSINDPAHKHNIYGYVDPGTVTNPRFPQASTGGWTGGDGGKFGISYSSTGITIHNAGDVFGTNAPYIQLMFCQKP